MTREFELRANKNPGIAAGVLHSCTRLKRMDQKSMPPMPPPAFFFGSSATMASVVVSRAATESSLTKAIDRFVCGDC
jgi:hypothetical protein